MLGLMGPGAEGLRLIYSPSWHQLAVLPFPLLLFSASRHLATKEMELSSGVGVLSHRFFTKT